MAKLTSRSKNSSADKTTKKSNGTKNGKKSNKAAKIVDLEDDVTDEEEEELLTDDETIGNGNGKHDAQDEPMGSSSSSSLLADCEKYFGSRDLYSILNLDKAKANESEIKKAYYKLSLKYHPDKAEDAKRDESTIKFQVLSKIYSILSDGEKKKLYDEQGIVDDESSGLEAKDWNEYWRTLFKKVTKADFEKFFAEYRESPEERADLLRIYEKQEGDMGEILDEMFTQDRVADESRFRKIIEEAIKKGEVKSHKKFTNESKQKAGRRKKAYEREAIEAEVERVKHGIDDSEESLKHAILSRRQANFDDLCANLEKKYGGDNKNSKKTTNKKKAAAQREDQEDDDFEENDDEDEEYETKPKKAKGASKASSAKKTAPKAGAAKKVKRL